MRRSPTWFLFALLLLTTAFAPGFGQSRTRSVYAIREAKIYTVSGPVLPRGTVIIRNGLIEAVGTDIQIPPEATVIPAAGLTVYPGLIDSFTDIGVANAAAAVNPNAQPQQVPRNAHEAIFQAPLGLNADRVLADQVRPEGRNIDAYRNLGITSALTVPRDGILAGQSAFINTGDTNMVVKSPVALHINPAPVRNGYPTTLMGAFAVLRQAFADAEWYQQAWQRFNANPRGLERPKYDSALESVGSAIQGKLPSIIQADWTDQIKRAVALADELKLKPIVIAGGLEAFSVAPLLKGKDIPVLASVNYAMEKPKAGFGGVTEAVEFDEKQLNDFYSNAALLQKAGVRFALQSGFADRPQAFFENIRKAMENGLTPEQALRATTLSAAEIFGLSNALGSLEPGKIANVVIATGDPFARESRIRQVFIDGKLFEITNAPVTAAQGQPAQQPAQAAPPASNNARKPVLRPGSYITPTSKEVLIRNATILTVTKGTIKNGSILLRDGKIAAVGTTVPASQDAQVIDASGKFVMPGIIDAHSHMAIEGGGNETASPVTPNVRIADVIRDDDITIYRALAGGTTIAHILHGSANVIGGTDAVIKLKWGRPAEDFLFGAPLGIKFALGENPKRSNTNQTVATRRFPATRMGVEETLRESFTEARHYMKEWEDYQAARSRGQNVIPPRRDLKLETLSDVLRGKIIVHVHSYVAPEIIMMLGLADEFGFKIGTLHHVLEGYKVAKEIAAHGVGASTFADFWSYKWEAWDAIPFNAAMMSRQGIVVSVNSDSDERVRRLYEEAGRALHYSNGELSEDDALKLITLNPAIQLGIDKRVGSIEVGKDADLAIFSAHPFSSAAHVEMTMVDGQIYFDRAEDLKSRTKGDSQ